MPQLPKHLKIAAQRLKLEQDKAYFRRIITAFQSSEVDPSQFLANLSSYRDKLIDVWHYRSDDLADEIFQLSLTFVHIVAALPLYGGAIGDWSIILERVLPFYLETGRILELAHGYLHRSVEYSLISDSETALDYAQQAYQLGQKLKFPFVVARAMYLRLVTLIDMNNAPSTPILIDETTGWLSTISKDHPDYAIAETLVLASYAQFFRRVDKRDVSLKYWLDVLNNLKAMSNPPPWLLALAYREYGLVQTEKGDNLGAAMNLQAAKHIYSQIGYVIPLIYTYEYLGLAYWGLGKLPDAVRILEEGISWTLRTRALAYRLRLGGALALVALAQGKFDDAIGYVESQYLEAVQFNIETEIARARGNTGVIRLYQAWHSTGAVRDKFLSEAVDKLTAGLWESFRDRIGQAVCLEFASLALSYSLRGDLLTAQRLAEKALRLANKMGQISYQVVALRCFAEVIVDIQHKRSVLETALFLSRRTDRRLDEAGCLLRLAEIAPFEEQESIRQQASTILTECDAMEWLAYATHPMIMALA